MKLADLAAHLECRLEGDGTVEITRVAGLDRAGPGDLTFFTNARYQVALAHTQASAVLVADDGTAVPCAALRSPHPYLSVARAVALLHPLVRPAPGRHPSAIVAPDADIDPSAAIGPCAVIASGVRIGARTIVDAHVVVGAGASIGDDCWLHAHVSVRERVRLGNRVTVQDGAVIGSDGFGFARRADGSHEKIPQVGDVVIEDDVDIGAHTAIDRPAVGETRIHTGAKIDNLVQVAHGVSVGEHAILAAQVGIAGSTVIEDRVTLAGQVGVAGHVRVGRGAIATAQTGIPNSVEPGSFVSGYPAVSNREWLRASAVFRKLPQLRRLVQALDARLEALERRVGSEAPSQQP